MATPQSPEAKELSLVGKVEMRIALADGDQKLQATLNTYLAPLLLKLASEHMSVRNKVIGICQHVNTRIKPESIKLPVAALVEQFKSNPNIPLIRHFDLLYIQTGIRRMSFVESTALFPVVLQSVASAGKTSPTHGSQMFNLLLQLLKYFKLPPRGTKEDDELRSTLELSDEDTSFLAFWFGKLILFSVVKGSSITASVTCPGLRPSEYSFLTLQNRDDVWNPASPMGLNLLEIKSSVARVLASGMFTDKERILPALFASTESTSGIGEDMLKRTLPNISLEDPDFVQSLYTLYFGDEGIDSQKRARVPLQLRILGLFAKSTVSTTFTEQIVRLVNDGIATSGNEDPSALGREATKLRAAIFVYINFVSRFGSEESLYAIAPRVLGRLREYIEGQGWPKPSQNEDLVSRGYAYEVIGLLAKAGPKDLVVEPNLDILRWLFESLALDTTTSSVTVSIEESLSSMLGAFAKHGDPETATSLENLLIDQMYRSGTPQRRSTRYVAVRYANRCLPYASVKARWVNLLAIAAEATDRQEVVEEGRRGLSPYWYRMLNGSVGTSQTDESVKFPPFQTLMDYVFYQAVSDISGSSTDHDPATAVQQLLQRHPNAFMDTIKYCRRVFMHDAMSKSSTQVKLDADWEYKFDTAIENDEQIRQTIKDRITQLVVEAHGAATNLQLLLRAFSVSVLIVEGSKIKVEDADKLFLDLCALSPDALVETVAPQFVGLVPSISSNKLATRQSAAHAFGLLASHPRNQVDRPTEVLQTVQQLLSKILSWREAVGAAGNQVHGAVSALGFFYSRYALRGGNDFESSAPFAEYMTKVVEILLQSTDKVLQESAYNAIGDLCLFQAVKPATFEKMGGLKAIIDKTADIAKGGSESAALAVGQMATVLEEPTTDAEEKSLLEHASERLHQLHDIRQAETHFSVGEALSYTAVGWRSRALVHRTDVESSAPTGPARVNSLRKLLDRTLQDCKQTKPSLKKASVIWLLCLVQFCGHLEEVQTQLAACQVAFKKCLSDRDELVQETASRGLGLVYEKGDRNLKDDLVRDLIGSFSSDNKAQLAGSVTAETQLFEPGALPTGDGSVTTYKDIMSLAAEVGDSSLVYRFMSLASSNAIWSSRAAFGRFGLSNVLSDSSVDGYLASNPKLYPKLYRYRFDPNPGVQRSMTDIWNALVKDSTATIDSHFDAIMDDLLLNILGKEWRVRQASCAAIGDLVQGRPLEKYEKYLEKIWGVCFKVLDDIKESVRAAAATLARVLTGILTRSLEADTMASKNAGVLLKNVLPFLLSTSGIESSAEEVQSFSLHTLLEIIKKASGKILRPFIPELVERLVGLLSILEPQAVNYLHLNASKYNLTEQKIDDIRLSSIRSSPLMEAIERCLDLLDENSMEQLQPRLEAAMKSAVGLPSKVGCSRVLVSLSTRHNVLFKPYADQFLRLIERQVIDRNETVSSSYAASSGYVARGASDKQVLRLATFAKKLYFESEGDREQAVPRQSIAAAEIMQAISKHANDRFNSLASDFLPFIFFGKHDSHDQVKEIFRNTWEDNVGGSRAISLYLKEILSMAQEHMDSPQWVIKHTAARSVADATTALASMSSGFDTTTSHLIWPVLEKALSGKTWDGKEAVLYAFAKFVENTKHVWSAEDAFAKTFVKIILREAKRQNVTYRPHAIKCLGLVAANREDLELFDVMCDVIKPVFTDVVDAENEDNMDVDNGVGAGDKDSRESTTVNGVEALCRPFDPSDVAWKKDQKLMEKRLDRVVETLQILQPMRTEGHASFRKTMEKAKASLLACLQGEIQESDAGRDLHRRIEGLQATT
ncbi:ARM repeat-containing protein [Aureobasidium subglaciale]|nr:ARM repeat-containing protein [Aureobasidium subglaciale]